MKERRISHTQLMALLWAGVLAPAAELLPLVALPGGGKGAWLSPLAAAVPVLAVGWLIHRRTGERGLAEELRGRFGRGFLIIYVAWAELLLAVRLRLCARRLLVSGYRDGTLWFFVLAVAGLMLWMGSGKLAAFARAGQLVLVVLGITGAAVLLLALSGVRLVRILPLWSGDVIPVIRSALPTAGVLGWGLAGAFLTGSVEPKKDGKAWYGLFWGLGGCVLLTVAQGVILGNLGSVLTGRLDAPFFTLTKSVGVEGAFQRVESVVTALWTLADLLMGTVLVFALRELGKVISPQMSQRRWVVAVLTVAVVLALTVFGHGRGEVWNRGVLPWVNVTVAVTTAGLLCLTGSRE